VRGFLFGRRCGFFSCIWPYLHLKLLCHRLFFLATNNFGDTWQTIEHPESPANIYVNDMVSVTEDGQEVIYLGTNKGLYSFTVQSY
jgi:hypothetical protein